MSYGFWTLLIWWILMILLTNKNPPKKLSIDIFPIVGPLRVCVKTAVRTEKSHVICAKSNLWSFGMAQYFGCHSSQTHCWEPENGGPLEKGNSYWKSQFSGSYLIFQPVVTSKNPTKLPCGGNPNKSVVKIHEGNGINWVVVYFHQLALRHAGPLSPKWRWPEEIDAPCASINVPLSSGAGGHSQVSARPISQQNNG